MSDAFASYAPAFWNEVRDFPDFKMGLPLTAAQISALEEKNSFCLPKEVKDLLEICSYLKMNGLSFGADEFGSIAMPESDGLIIGYFYLYNAADRLLLLPGDPAIYYLEQHNGAISKLASNMREFLNKTLPRYL